MEEKIKKENVEKTDSVFKDVKEKPSSKDGRESGSMPQE